MFKIKIEALIITCQSDGLHMLSTGSIFIQWDSDYSEKEEVLKWHALIFQQYYLLQTFYTCIHFVLLTLKFSFPPRTIQMFSGRYLWLLHHCLVIVQQSFQTTFWTHHHSFQCDNPHVLLDSNSNRRIRWSPLLCGGFISVDRHDRKVCVVVFIVQSRLTLLVVCPSCNHVSSRQKCDFFFLYCFNDLIDLK